MSKYVVLPPSRILQCQLISSTLIAFFWSILSHQAEFFNKPDYTALETEEIVTGYAMIGIFLTFSLFATRLSGLGRSLSTTQAGFRITAIFITRSALATIVALVLYFAAQSESKMVWIPFLLCATTVSIGEKFFLAKYFRNLTEYEAKDKINLP
tara:strand:- start:288 stop:749 length:462 start_codon:yes stop_codon:yes gene_type:complete